MKQTAVEWLMSQMLAASVNKETEEMHITLPKDVFKQAKAMEKEQIVEAVDCCLSSIQLSEDKNSFIALSAEQYYNERFVLKTI